MEQVAVREVDFWGVLGGGEEIDGFYFELAYLLTVFTHNHHLQLRIFVQYLLFLLYFLSMEFKNRLYLLTWATNPYLLCFFILPFLNLKIGDLILTPIRQIFIKNLYTLSLVDFAEYFCLPNSVIFFTFRFFLLLFLFLLFIRSGKNILLEL